VSRPASPAWEPLEEWADEQPAGPARGRGLRKPRRSHRLRNGQRRKPTPPSTSTPARRCQRGCCPLTDLQRAWEDHLRCSTFQQPTDLPMHKTRRTSSTGSAGKPASNYGWRSSPGSRRPTTADAGNAASDDSPRSNTRHSPTPQPRPDTPTRRVNRGGAVPNAVVEGVMPPELALGGVASCVVRRLGAAGT
jgi:hypothetical protein